MAFNFRDKTDIELIFHIWKRHTRRVRVERRARRSLTLKSLTIPQAEDARCLAV